MSGIRARGELAYAHYDYLKCVCGRRIKNFDAHTRTKIDQDHTNLRRIHDRLYLEELKGIPLTWQGDAGIRSGCDQRAWRYALMEVRL